MTGKEFGQKQAFRDGMDIQTWLFGQGFQGLLASGRRLGTDEIVEELNPLVDSLLKDIANHVPPKTKTPVSVEKPKASRCSHMVGEIVGPGLAAVPLIVTDRYSRAVDLLNLWINPMRIKCKASGHNEPNTQSCTCRQNELERRTRDLIGECGFEDVEVR